MSSPDHLQFSVLSSSATSLEEKVSGKKGNNMPSWRLYGYNVTSLTYVWGSTGSQYHSNNDTTHLLGKEHSVAKKLTNKIHEHTIHMLYSMCR